MNKKYQRALLTFSSGILGSQDFATGKGRGFFSPLYAQNNALFWSLTMPLWKQIPIKFDVIFLCLAWCLVHSRISGDVRSLIPFQPYCEGWKEKRHKEASGFPASTLASSWLAAGPAFHKWVERICSTLLMVFISKENSCSCQRVKWKINAS